MPAPRRDAAFLTPTAERRVPTWVGYLAAVIVFGGFWACLMGALQRGMDGFRDAAVATLVGIFLMGVLVDTLYGIGRLIVPVRVGSLGLAIVGWLLIIGSYSIVFDVLALVVSCVAAFFLIYRGDDRKDRLKRLHFNFIRFRWGDPEFALVTDRARCRFRKFAATWLLLVWVSSSTLDAWLGWNPILTSPVVRTRSIKAEWRDRKVGVALSGGGYRAALMHGGVLDALEQLQVPITHISCVSGGAIQGAFYAFGGKPRDFLQAAEDHRFNLRRDMADAHNALRLVMLPCRIPLLDIKMFPLASFSRTDVQANMIRRVLLGDARLADLPPGAPQLMVCATDLRRAVAIGFVTHGAWISSLPTVSGAELPKGRAPERFSETSLSQFPANEPIANLVAASGAFPGAFNAVAANIPMGTAADSEVESVYLVDGGVFDNSGLGLMLDAHRGHSLHGQSVADMKAQGREILDRGQQRPPARPEPPEPPEPTEQLPGPPWRLDFVIVSDGGEVPEAASRITDFGELMRTIDVLYACSGMRFLMLESYQRGRPPVVLLGNSPFSARPVGWVAAVARGVVKGVKKLAETGSISEAFDSAREHVASDSTTAKGDDPVTEMLKTAIARVSPETMVVAEQWRNSGVLPGAPSSGKPGWIIDDIRECLRVFGRTSTLVDHLTPTDARSLHRLGQYLVLLNWNEIERGLGR